MANKLARGTECSLPETKPGLDHHKHPSQATGALNDLFIKNPLAPTPGTCSLCRATVPTQKRSVCRAGES